MPTLKVFDRNYDPRIGVTIMLIIANFLKENPNALLAYMCSGLDRQDRHRHISFGKWYNSSDLRDQFDLLKRKVGDTYCGILFDKNHPERQLIDETFIDFTFGKPDGVEDPEEVYLLYDEEAFDSWDAYYS